MKKLIKNITTDNCLLFKKIYYFILINKNKKIGKDQDIELYDQKEAAERIDEWGEDNVVKATALI